MTETKEKKSAKKKKKEDLRLSKSEVYLMTRLLMNEWAAPPVRSHDLWKPFPRKFFVKREQGGINHIEVLNNKLVAIVQPSEISSAILSYWQNEAGFVELATKGTVTKDDAKRVYEKWVVNSREFSDTVHYVADKDSDVYCLNRIDASFVRGVDNKFGFGAAPLFEELMSRWGNAKEFMALIGAAMDPTARPQVYAWAGGPGGSGKSTMANILMRVFENSYVSTYVPKGRYYDKFWSNGFAGKRLGIMDDVEDHEFLESDQLKSLTGGKTLRVEFKGQDAYNAPANALLFFFSNYQPTIDVNSVANLRRLILCKVDERKKNFGAHYESRIWREIGVFLGACMDEWEELQRQGFDNIPVDSECTKIELSENNDKYEAFVSKYFELDDGAILPASDLQRALIMHRIISSNHQAKYKEHLKDNYGIDRTQQRFNGARRWVYRGLKLKQNVYI